MPREVEVTYSHLERPRCALVCQPCDLGRRDEKPPRKDAAEGTMAGKERSPLARPPVPWEWSERGREVIDWSRKDGTALYR